MFISRIAILIVVALLAINVNAKDCLKSNGYTSGFTVSSFNTYYPTGGSTVPLSFFEVGDTSVDFQGKRMRVNYEIIMSGVPVMNGSLWGFGDTNTMYILSEGICKTAPLGFPIPQGFVNGSVVGTTKLGQFEVEVWNIPTEAPNTQTMFYDKHTCSGVSSIVNNNDPSSPGASTMLFFEFIDTYTESFFTLPPQCTQPNAPIAAFTSMQDAFPHIPKSILHQLR
ncbi:hypothetical protein DFA_06503 [Cavenderia fasciculata]|uniref:Ependymin-related protein n=1 Tax=Cavenderia fasciculata TaxID=261658 RepID=F4PJ67_CACFS|nr:uncharacterized protein DFA_06503 [Cavenderia fasciculata]EGG24353.1 hypothetical protein DFA_06503 [Cavenderia fasciculata]|eukprot:XP_004362204.1 hypothetical protein DFA_06503 [Cavenderia fasciculata]